MTKKQAIRILIQAAARDVRGAGKGIRSTSDEWRKEVEEAVKVAYKMAEGVEPNKNTMFNFGF